MNHTTTYLDNKKLTVVNFFGGPGLGKTHTAMSVSLALRERGIRTEYVPEFAKDVTYDNNLQMLYEQDVLIAEQNRRLRRLVTNVDIAVMDGSLLLSLMYQHETFPQTFIPYVLDTYHSYTNINILLERNAAIPYHQYGRIQTLAESEAIDKECEEMLTTLNIPFIRVVAGAYAASEVVYHISSINQPNQT